MGLDIFLRDDIANVLESVASAGFRAAQAAGTADEMYLRGYADALSATALAFGIFPERRGWAPLRGLKRG